MNCPYCAPNFPLRRFAQYRRRFFHHTGLEIVKIVRLGHHWLLLPSKAPGQAAWIWENLLGRAAA